MSEIVTAQTIKHQEPVGSPEVCVVGAGLSGSECALTLARLGVSVKLYEMRPHTSTEAHKTALPAELVCSNSFKSEREDSAAGQLKRELKTMGSSLYPLMLKARVAAGGALAVDREIFSRLVQEALESHERIEIYNEEVRELSPDKHWIICAGPLASAALMDELASYIGEEQLYFYDAAAPIVEADTLDMTKLFSQSRHDSAGEGDYLNAAFDKEGYEAFYQELISAERLILKDFEKKELFQACQPVEEVARSGKDALRYGALKPVGIEDPHTQRRPWAVVQLRAENAEKTAYNLVGFQTNLKFPEQKRVFRMIPGLEGAEFSRYGVMHKNTYLNAPRLLDGAMHLKGYEHISFAGQITGTEGYTEAVASGFIAALQYVAFARGLEQLCLPKESVFGALLHYMQTAEPKHYQPMHVNFGIMPPFEKKIKNKRERYQAYVDRAQAALEAYLQTRPELFGALM